MRTKHNNNPWSMFEDFSIGAHVRKVQLAFVGQGASRDAQNDITKKHPKLRRSLRRGTNKIKGRKHTWAGDNVGRRYRN